MLVNDLQMDFSRTRIVAEQSSDCAMLVDRAYRELEDKAGIAFTRQRSDSALRLSDHACAMSSPLILMTGRNPGGVVRHIRGRNSARKTRSRKKPAKINRNQKLKMSRRTSGK